ncbi:hypothetical protein ERJ75_000075100 [Trypanosoma vivax]|nr:hypothetical protein ERJ75_000075100 [Trypanosoma vivax]
MSRWSIRIYFGFRALGMLGAVAFGLVAMLAAAEADAQWRCTGESGDKWTCETKESVDGMKVNLGKCKKYGNGRDAEEGWTCANGKGSGDKPGEKEWTCTKREKQKNAHLDWEKANVTCVPVGDGDTSTSVISKDESRNNWSSDPPDANTNEGRDESSSKDSSDPPNANTNEGRDESSNKDSSDPPDAKGPAGPKDVNIVSSTSFVQRHWPLGRILFVALVFPSLDFE